MDSEVELGGTLADIAKGDDEYDLTTLGGEPSADGEELSLVQVRHLIDNLNAVQPPKKRSLFSLPHIFKSPQDSVIG